MFKINIQPYRWTVTRIKDPIKLRLMKDVSDKALELRQVGVSDPVKLELMKLVSNIELALKEMGSPLADFLKSVPIGYPTWSNWKLGKRTAHAGTWYRVTDAFNRVKEAEEDYHDKEGKET